MVPPRAALARSIRGSTSTPCWSRPDRSAATSIDLFRLDADRVGFLIGDVTGKGVPAALFMAMSKALTSFVLTRENADLAAPWQRQRELLRGGGDALSVTMIIGVIDLGTGAVSLVCAGHEDPITLERRRHGRAPSARGRPAAWAGRL